MSQLSIRTQSPRWYARLVTGVMVALTAFAGLAPVRGFAAPNTLEYQLKAVFLLNFAKFVEWPVDSLPPTASLRVGIIAPDIVFGLMEKELANKVAGNRSLQIERVTAAQIQNGTGLPNIIFVHQDTFRSQTESGISPQQLAALGEKQPVLLVGESIGFAVDGGMIGFVQRGENLRFQVNLANAQRAGLKLTARLAGLAEIVNSAKP